jgi:hypothetical protein
MRQLYESKFQVLLYSERDRLFISEWKHSRERPTNDEYFQELHQLHSYFKTLKPLRYYSNISNLTYDLSKEERAYAANLFKDDTATYNAIVTNKIFFDAFVEEVVNELEQLTEDFMTKYFHDQNKAMKWLLECGTKKATNAKNLQVAESLQ